MDELRELYQQVILDHNNSPRNYGRLDEPCFIAEGDNPLCGDHLIIYLLVEDNCIKNIRFEGKGCAISIASASLMTSELKGNTAEEAKEVFNKFHNMITKETEDLPDFDELGKLTVLAGVKAFPLRVKCASLAWHTMLAALNSSKETVTTE